MQIEDSYLTSMDSAQLDMVLCKRPVRIVGGAYLSFPSKEYTRHRWELYLRFSYEDQTDGRTVVPTSLDASCDIVSDMMTRWVRRY
jgi:hypothetical protein